MVGKQGVALVGGFEPWRAMSGAHARRNGEKKHKAKKHKAKGGIG